MKENNNAITRKLGKKGIWLPAIFNILVLIVLGITVMFFFWWLLFGGKEKALEEIEEKKIEVSRSMNLYSLLRTDIMQNLQYTGSDAAKLTELSKQEMSIADAIGLSYIDKENSEYYKQMVSDQVKYVLDKHYGALNYGFFVDFPNEIGSISINPGVRSGEVAEAAIPTLDKQIIKVRLITVAWLKNENK
ncbi:MAG: hypothetical protein N3D84_02190 [Candidatus Woesearchaeota archaeon]|nr:hypothetical protein [Candidatus Woesearchaeota archaeon]